mmetsp:Transcript_23788/g.33259  ORF Transcript_23788/g.33259 Transcript_23788/m.33259 type:complete len:177 (+) Transcript_23788:92-622(+)
MWNNDKKDCSIQETLTTKYGEKSVVKKDKTDGWILLEDSPGVNAMVDSESGNVITLTTSHCRDDDRWETMPTLESYSQLETLDLTKNRYIKELDSSITTLTNLRSLILKQCESLKSLPTDIGLLQQLQEVRKGKFIRCSILQMHSIFEPLCLFVDSEFFKHWSGGYVRMRKPYSSA